MNVEDLKNDLNEIVNLLDSMLRKVLNCKATNTGIYIDKQCEVLTVVFNDVPENCDDKIQDYFNTIGINADFMCFATKGSAIEFNLNLVLAETLVLKSR